MDEGNSQDLYTILSIDKGSSQSEIKTAYRRLAVRWHPDKNVSSDKEEAEKRFKEIANAFAILSDEDLRRKYDEGGIDALQNKKKSEGEGREGGVDGSSANSSSYNSKEVFDSFFAHENPFAHLGFDASTDFRSRKKVNVETTSKDEEKGGGKQGRHPMPSPMEEIHELPCSLEDLYLGSEKVVKITRYRLSDHGDTLEESKILRVKLNPSTHDGTTFKFPGDGDESMDCNGKVQTSHLILRIKEIPHDIFQRDGLDLIFTAHITLVQALTFCKIKVPTLGGKTLLVSFPEVIHTKYKRILKGEGMIDPNILSKRGDIVIKFEIEFPQTPLREEVKQELCRLLS